MKKQNLNIQNREIWETNAKSWDSAMGESGNLWHKELIAPLTEKLLHLKKGDTLLDVGCGNGIFARQMAKKDIQVTAFDFASKNIERAKTYDSTNIDYQVLDVTCSDDLKSLGSKKYNGIVSNMVLMDVPEIETLFSYIKELLKDDGSFVFSIQHPCFNSEYVTETEDNSLLLSNYAHSSISKGVAIAEQEKEQFYFHRSISYYINVGIKHGLVVTGFEEPLFDNTCISEVYSKFPPVLIVSIKKNI